MIPTFVSIFSLLLGVGVLLLGSGLLGTLIGLRGALEGYPPSLLGAIMSAYFLGFMLGCYLLPAIVRRTRHIRAFTACAAAVCACTLMHAISVEPAVWMLLRFVAGFSMLGIYLTVESWLNAMASSRNRGMMFSMYMSVTLFGIAGGQFLLLPYGAAAIESFVLAGLLIAVAALPIALTRMVEPIPAEAPELHLGALVDASPLGTAGAFASGIVNGAFWGLGAVYAQRLGLAEHEIALFLATVIVGGAMLQVPIGHLSDTRDRRKVLLGAAALAGIVAAGMWYAGADHRQLLFLYGALYGGFSFAVYSISVAVTNDHLPPDAALEGARGLLLLNGIGASIGPAMGGLVMGWLGPGSLVVLFAGVMALLSICALYRVLRHGSLDQEPQAPFVSMARTSPAALEMYPHAEVALAAAEIDEPAPARGAAHEIAAAEPAAQAVDEASRPAPGDPAASGTAVPGSG